MVHMQHDCKTELRDADLKATPARLGVLEVLEKASSPVDVATILASLQKQDIKADPATIFRIVNSFAKQGLAKQIQFNEGKFRYELSSTVDHHHLICEQCGNIEDISDCNIKALEKDIQNKKKFTVTHHSLEFFGLCRNCQA